MKVLAVWFVFLLSAKAFVQESVVPDCKLLSDKAGTRVWQCAPTPATQ